MTCNVTGPLILPTGEILPNTELTFQWVPGVSGTGTATIVGRDVPTTSDAAGLIDVDLQPGNYLAYVMGSERRLRFAVGVPDAATASLHDCIDQAPEITPGLVQQVVELRDEVVEIADAFGGVANLETIRDEVDADRQATAAYAGQGINVVDAASRTASYTVTGTDMGILQIVTPTAATTLDVTLPPANAHIGKVIAFVCPSGTSGRVRFLITSGQASSVVADYPNDNFWIWQRESVTLLAQSAGWVILDWQKNPLFVQALGPSSNINLSTTGAAVEVNGWVSPAWDSNYLRHYRWALDGGSPQRLIVPRRGKFIVEANIFVSWTGTAPTSIFATVPSIDGSTIANRAYATFVSATQAVIKYEASAQNAAGAQIVLNVHCTGGTSPVVAGATANGQPVIRLTEIV